MKVFDLLHSLTATEKKAFDNVMNNHSRQQIKNLYQYVRKTPSHQISNDRMYLATYGHPYTKAKDYLLRNELRLLAGELKQMLIKLELEKELKQNPNTANTWYIKALRARGLDEYFDGEFEKLYSKAANELQFRACMDMRFEQMQRVGENWTSHLDFEHMEQTINKYKNSIGQFAGNAIRYSEMNSSLITKLTSIVQSKKGTSPLLQNLQDSLLYPHKTFIQKD